VIKARTVWKDLGSRRIGKSLEEVRVRDDVKEQGFLMVVKIVDGGLYFIFPFYFYFYFSFLFLLIFYF